MRHHLPSCITPRRVAITVAGWLALVASAAVARPVEGSKFLRFVESAERSQLQTSIVRYVNAAGVKVDLIGAVHIADPSYFEALNERFKKYDAMLYEMVKPRGAKDVDLSQREEKSTSWVSGLQRFMKDQLELDFQLDRVDYAAANFVHADLDAETFLERQEARGETMLSLMLDSMMHEMNKGSVDRGGTAEMGIMDLVQALQAPDRGRQLKLVLGRQFANLDDALGAMGGAQGSVILDERNKHAMQTLARQIEAGKKNLAIFYGAGHMKGMDETLTTLMGFKQVGEPEWLVAWDIETSPKAAAKPLSPSTRPSTAPVGAKS